MRIFASISGLKDHRQDVQEELIVVDECIDLATSLTLVSDGLDSEEQDRYRYLVSCLTKLRRSIERRYKFLGDAADLIQREVLWEEQMLTEMRETLLALEIQK